MKKTGAFLLTMLTLFCLEHPLKAQELKVRNGLPNVSHKIKDKDSLTIVYFGGSITNQRGWRDKSFMWFEGQFPGAFFKQVNASIGGTNSQLGAFRLKEHVLSFDPDLIFVEFAVNDGGMSEERISQSMEGIVRQIWRDNLQCDICFVYTMRASMLETVLSGDIPHTVAAMEQVADYYHIPSIWFAPEVTRQVDSGELLMQGESESINGIPVFSSDGVHPYFNTGQELYAKVVRRCIPVLLEKANTEDRRLGVSLNEYNMEGAQMLDPSEIKLKGAWESEGPGEDVARFLSYMPGMVKTSRSGDEAVLKFTGTEIGCFDIMGPGAGKIFVSIDGVVSDTVYRFDKYCTYYRMNNFLITGLENTEHIVHFEFNGDPFDKVAILRERQKNIEASVAYEEYSWYLGKILLLGSINE